MSDTLTHLPTTVAVDQLLSDAAGVLRQGGLFVATVSDYTGGAPAGPARFIPVRADRDRIRTCCIEYGAETVEVTDLINEWQGERWEFRARSYRKVRLAPQAVVARLEAEGLTVRAERDGPGRGQESKPMNAPSHSEEAFEMLVGLHVIDDEAYDAYRREMEPMLQAIGGGFAYDFRVEQTLRSESDKPINRVFTIYFPSELAIIAFFEDPQYRKVKERHFERSVAAMTIIAKYPAHRT